MSPRVPLQLEEREIISRELCRDVSPREIAKQLGRHHSTIYEEINRNGGKSEYRAVDAQRRADAHRVRPKERKLETSPQLHDAVNDGLKQDWSPEQISKRLRIDYPDDPQMHISHETIYECIYLQVTGEVTTELRPTLRQGRTRRAERSRPTVARGKIKDMINISDRPDEADDRAVPGYWEGDRATWKAAHVEWSYHVEGRLARV
jgi:IS30 family transposase